MIGRGLKTGVDQKFFNARVTVEKELFNGERYVYRVRKDGVLYILKGYQILLEHLKPGDEESRQRFINVLSAISEAYQEYFFSKIACLFNQHFAKPLEIDQEVELTSDVNSLSYLYIEILFEYSGEPLNSMTAISIDSTYNLMRQSANALSLLHNTGLMHLDIKPSNMMYNDATNLVKMMDVGTSFGYGTHSIICKPTNTAKPCIREFTREFAPPEIIKERYGFNIPIDKLLAGNVDVYCWAMCFYTMLLEKSVAALIHEANFYKLKTQEEYDKFMNATKAAMEKIDTREPMEQKKKKFILEQIYEALSFHPQDRPSICEIQRRMKDFEKREKIEISYEKIEKDYEWKMMKMLMIGEERKGRAPSDAADFAGEIRGKSDNVMFLERNARGNLKTDKKPIVHVVDKKEQILSERNSKEDPALMNRKNEMIGKTYSSMIEKGIKTNRDSAQESSSKRQMVSKRESVDPSARGGVERGKNLKLSIEDYSNYNESMMDSSTGRKDKNLQSTYFGNVSSSKNANSNYNSMINPSKGMEGIGKIYFYPLDNDSKLALQKFSVELAKMRMELEASKNSKTNAAQKKPEGAGLPPRPSPKVEFLGSRIETHIDPRMNDPDFVKKQMEQLSKVLNKL